MANILKCKMCGGDITINNEKTYGTCDFCGSVMTFPKVEDEQRLATFNRGNQFRRAGEFDKAILLYEQLIRDDDTDAEAHWCCALSRFGIEYVEDPITLDYIPTCHRASIDSFLEDVDYLAAVKYSDGVTQKQYQKDAMKIAEVQKGILATSQKEEPFDVFICYKETDTDGNRTVDSSLAQDIYYQLTDEGYKVFFSRITLEDKVGSEYEPYIFAALNSAKVMVVVGTSKENLDAVWVKNEWSRYLALMRKDRKRVILPCYRDMDPYDMPEALSVLQSYDMSKIGFIQDLIRGIEKIVNNSTEEKNISQSILPKYTSHKQSFDDIRIEKEVNKAVEFMNTKSLRKIREAQKILEKLGSFYDTSKEISECERRISDITKRKKRQTKVTLLTLVLLMVISSVIITYIRVIRPEQQYVKANEMVENNNFDAAIEIYNKLVDYKDASELSVESQYKKGLYQYKNGEKRNSIYTFKALGSYKDAEEKVIEITDEVLTDEFEAGNVEIVKEILSEVYNTNDVEITYDVLKNYINGLEEYNNHNYVQALKYLTKSVDYMNSNEMIYQSAKKLSEAKWPYDDIFVLSVCDGFSKISGYKDSDELLEKYKKKCRLK